MSTKLSKVRDQFYTAMTIRSETPLLAGFVKCRIPEDRYRITFIAVGEPTSLPQFRSKPKPESDCLGKKHHLRMFPKSRDSGDNKTGRSLE